MEARTSPVALHHGVARDGRSRAIAWLVALVVVLAMAYVAPMSAQDGEPDETTPAESAAGSADDQDAEAPASPFEPFDEVVGETEVQNGLFDVYDKSDGKLLLAIPEDRLDADFFLTFEIARGIGARGLFGGLMFGFPRGRVVAFERHANSVYLVQRPDRFPAEPDTSTAEAVDLTYGSSVLATAAIAAVRDDGALIVDIAPWAVSDLSGISDGVSAAVAPPGSQRGRATLDRDRSFLESVKVFPNNLNVRARLTFTPGEPVSINSVPDSRYIPVSVHMTMASLPEVPMTPRLADDRVGFFLTAHKDFTNDDDSSFFRRYVNRWRLECAGPPTDGLCDPREPIVYYVDRTVPVEYRQAMLDGIRGWNAAFETAGFRNAVRGEMLPDGADAEDIRYPTLRWNVSDDPDYSGIGPSVVDPRTGEILDADILFEHNMILRFKRTYRTGIDPATAFNELFDASDRELIALAAGGEMASMADALAAQGTVLRTALAAGGALAPGEPVPDEFIRQAVTWVTMHEVGHTLGLRHNFKSSYDTPFDQLHDRAFASANGLMGSVMDYPSVNIAPPGETQGFFYSPVVGSADRWTVAYGYTEDPDRARDLARQSGQDGHLYATDEDARGTGSLDPRSGLYDLGDDPMAWGRQRADLIRAVWQALPDHVLVDDAPYDEVTAAYTQLLTEYGRAVATGVKYIGGQYQNREHRGDPYATQPFVAVPKDEQMAALAFVAEYGLSEQAFAIPAEVFQQFGATRWSHWGIQQTTNGRIDYPLHESIASLQASMIDQMTNPITLARIRDAEIKFGPANVATIPELMTTISEAVWSEVWTDPGRNIPSMRRDLQRAHLDRLVAFVTDAPGRTPADARAVARMMLLDLDRRIGSRLSAPDDFDAYTVAHLTEAQARIERALAAGLQIEN